MCVYFYSNLSREKGFADGALRNPVAWMASCAAICSKCSAVRDEGRRRRRRWEQNTKQQQLQYNNRRDGCEQTLTHHRHPESVIFSPFTIRTAFSHRPWYSFLAQLTVTHPHTSLHHPSHIRPLKMRRFSSSDPIVWCDRIAGWYSHTPLSLHKVSHSNSNQYWSVWSPVVWPFVFPRYDPSLSRNESNDSLPLPTTTSASAAIIAKQNKVLR